MNSAAATASFPLPTSKTEAILAARKLKADPGGLDAVWTQIESYPPEKSWRAAWVLQTLAGMRFSPPEGYAARLIRNAAATRHEGMGRCLLRAVLAITPLSEEEDISLADACLTWLDRPALGIGTLSPAIDGMVRLCVRYPELWPELALRLDRFRTNGSGNLSTGFAVTLRRAYDTYQSVIAPCLHGTR